MRPPRSSIEAIYALVFAVCVLVALLLLTGCKDGHALPAEPGPQVRGDSVVFPAASPSLERFDVDKVQAPADRDLQLSGRLVWDEDRTVRVFPPYAGRVIRMVAAVGDRVAAGQPLVEILSPDFGQVQSDARKARADLALATQSLARARELNEHGVAAAKDVQQAEADHARAQAEADRALARLGASGSAGTGESRFVLSSPMAGTVVERNLNPGQELRPDQPGAPLFVVTDPARLWVNLDAQEADTRYLRPGLPLRIASTQIPEQTFPGSLRQISDFVDPVARTLKVRGDVPNPERALKAEMFVTARIHVPGAAEPTVSARAVFLAGDRRYVFVRHGSTFERRAVAVGPESDGRMAVHSGLGVGEEVAVSGNLALEQMLDESRSVQYVEEKAPAS